MFFSKKNKLLSELQPGKESVGKVAVIVFVETLTRYTWAYTLRKGEKSGKNILLSLKYLVRDYDRQFSSSKIKVLGFDGEKGLQDFNVQAYLRQQKIRLHIRTGKVKSSVAERAILEIKRSMFRIDSMHKSNPPLSTAALLKASIRLLNQRVLRVGRKKTTFTPATLNTQAQCNKFVKQLETLNPIFYFSKFRIPKEAVTYKFSIGEETLVKQAAVHQPNVLYVKKYRRSILEGGVRANLGKERWTVTDRFPFLDNTRRISVMYEMENAFFVPESALIKIETSSSSPITASTASAATADATAAIEDSGEEADVDEVHQLRKSPSPVMSAAEEETESQSEDEEEGTDDSAATATAAAAVVDDNIIQST